MKLSKYGFNTPSVIADSKPIGLGADMMSRITLNWSAGMGEAQGLAVLMC